MLTIRRRTGRGTINPTVATRRRASASRNPAHSPRGVPSRASASPHPTAAAQVVDITWHRQSKTQGLRAFAMLLDAVVVVHQHDLLAQTRRELFEVAEQAVNLPRKIGKRAVVEEDGGPRREALQELRVDHRVAAPPGQAGRLPGQLEL